jgi:hypothetical protein
VIVTVFVTIENPHSNIKNVSADDPTGWPEKVPTILLPPKRNDCCLRRLLLRTFALKRESPVQWSPQAAIISLQRQKECWNFFRPASDVCGGSDFYIRVRVLNRHENRKRK